MPLFHHATGIEQMVAVPAWPAAEAVYLSLDAHLIDPDQSWPRL